MVASRFVNIELITWCTNGVIMAIPTYTERTLIRLLPTNSLRISPGIKTETIVGITFNKDSIL